MRSRFAAFAVTIALCALCAPLSNAQITQIPAGSLVNPIVLDFDSPTSGIPAPPPGTVSNTDVYFLAFGLQDVQIINNPGTHTAGSDTLSSGFIGNCLASVNNTLSIVAPGGAMDDHTAGAGWSFRLLPGTLATQFGCIVVDQVNHTMAVETWRNGALQNTFTFTMTGGFPNPYIYFEDLGTFDEVRFMNNATAGGWGVDDFTLGNVLACPGGVCPTPAPNWQTNSANASLDVDGVMVASPFAPTGAITTVGVGTAAMVNVGSALTGAPFEMFVTTNPLAAANAGSYGFNTPGNQAVNVNISDPAGLWLNGLVAPSLQPFPGNFTIPLALPTAASLSAQGLFLDPSAADGFSLTQGATVDFVTTQVLANIIGDDFAQNVPLMLPILMSGQTYNSIDIDTNGTIKMGNNGGFSDLSESADDFVNGIAQGGTPAPTIGVLWEDIDMGNRAATQVVRVTQDLSTGAVIVEWIDADYYPSTPVGNFTCRIENGVGGAITRVLLDYTGFTGTATEGLIGVTDGATIAGSVPVPHDLVMGLSNNPYIFSGANAAESLFQSFDGLGTLATPIPAEPIDVGGTILVFDEVAPGLWIMN